MKREFVGKLYIGTAAWGIPKEVERFFPGSDSHLERYSRVLSGVEINTSFYREHMPKTYEKWAQSTPEHFAFSVKLSRIFTHEQKLEADAAALRLSLSGIKQLGEKLRVLLVQLPPSLKFNFKTTSLFLSALRKTYQGPVALEARHATWAEQGHQEIFSDFDISMVVPDPNPLSFNEKSAQANCKTCYFRLHGSPEMYKSKYSPDCVKRIAQRIDLCLKSGAEVWCVFDNTQFGYATENALELKDILADE